MATAVAPSPNLMGGDFIRLTQGDGSLLFVNRQHVISVLHQPSGHGSMVTMDDGSPRYAVEEPVFVASLLGFRAGPVATVEVLVVEDPNSRRRG